MPTLTAEGSSYSHTGVAAAFTLALAAAGGTYALTGTAAVVGQTIPAAAGAYSLTGKSARTAATSSKGTYVLTGTAAVLSRTLVATSGTYALTGTAASAALAMPAGAGAYSLVGLAAVVTRPIQYYSLRRGEQKTSVVSLNVPRVGATVEIAVDASAMSSGEFVRLLTDVRQFINEEFWPAAPADLWTPDDLGADLLAWWNADDLGDGAVAAWADRVASNTPVQATEANQPAKSQTSFNGRGGVTFDGVNDQLTLSGVGTLPTGATPCEIWGVFQFGAGTNTLFGYGSNAAQRTIRRTAGQLQMFGGGANAVNFPTDVGITIAGARFDALLFTLRRNGVEVGSAAATLATGTDRIRIGASVAPTANNFFNGPIRHVLITNLLSLTTQQKMEGWLAHDARLSSLLPSSHPYAQFPPGV